MSNFNANDIFEIAIQIEKNGALFYRKAADKISDKAQKNFLLELASMEDDHEKTFEELRKKLKDSENLPTAFDPDDENAAYLKALADMRVFADKELSQDNVKQDIFKQIIISAIQAEKDSIVFYLGMKAMVPEKMGKARLDDIIKEEMGHIKVLAKKLSETKA